MNIKLDDIFLLVFLAVTALAIAVGILWAVHTEGRLKRFFLGKKANDLEDTITGLRDNIARLEKERVALRADVDTINKKLRKSISRVKMVRFNPFPDQGSNQSFAIGLQDEDGDGVVLSSLYSRERMSVFAKPIKNGKSDYELSNEEKNVL